MSDQEDLISSPSDRSKRPLEDDESISKHDSSPQHNRAHKRQAVPDPKTDTPYAAKSSKLPQPKETDGEDNKEAVIKFDDVEKDLEIPDDEDGDEIELTAETTAHISLRAIVSTKDAGVIIGKGGKNVSEIREQSGAKVTISEMVHGALERILTASGPLDAVALVGSSVPRSSSQYA
jgi:heterogeneous nuclear rnp K-like protein 2